MYKLRCFFCEFVVSAVQACDKSVPTELLPRDASLTDLYIHSKLERQSNHSPPRAPITALERTSVDPISQGFLPPDVHADAPDPPDQKRVTPRNGRTVTVNTDTEDADDILPTDFSIKSISMAPTYRNHHYINRNPNCFQSKKYIKIQLKYTHTSK